VIERSRSLRGIRVVRLKVALLLHKLNILRLRSDNVVIPHVRLKPYLWQFGLQPFSSKLIHRM
jgi:hypothetical protein